MHCKNLFLNKTKDTIEQSIKINLDTVIPQNHLVKEIYHYAVFPAGKLFRPLLLAIISYDLFKSEAEKQINDPLSDLSILCAAIETHHAYTLVHDDLPCMDNDDYRRNKPSTHKAYGEWKALLVGDGLLNASYCLLSKLKTRNLSEILKYFSWATGPKGLIQGQVRDLESDMPKKFSSIYNTHLLKTGRLIQFSISASPLLFGEKNKLTSLNKDLFLLGKNLGIFFQLIDDLTEFTVPQVSEHELKINPWPRFSTETMNEVLKNINAIKSISEKYNLNTFQNFANNYLLAMQEKILNNKDNVTKHAPNITSNDIDLLTKTTLC